MDVKSFLDQLFDKKHPLGKMLRYIFSGIVILLFLKLITGYLAKEREKEQKVETVENVIQENILSKTKPFKPFSIGGLKPVTLDSAKYYDFFKIGEQAIMLHLQKTKQVDTLYVHRKRVTEIQDSLMQIYLLKP